MNYEIFLDGNRIGTTKLENADAPMGVVFGKIEFLQINSGYSFFKIVCSEKQIGFEDFPEDKLISTRNIPGLVVETKTGIVLNGLGCSVTGMDSDIFEITIKGIPYPFYEKLFTHVREYRNSL